MTFDVVSLVYNREKDVLELLTSLKKQTILPAKVWLIDNGSLKPLQIDTSLYPFPVEIYRIEKNIGIAGYNKGFEISAADFVIAVDSDVTLNNDTVEKFKQAVRNFPELIVAGAKILDSNSHATMPDNPIHGSRDLTGGGRQMVQFNGCCFMMRRTAFLSLGGFDQRLYIYVNEWDLTLKAFRSFNPEQIRYYPEIIAYHKTAPSQDRSKLYTALIRRNELWVRWKYYPVLSALDYTIRFFTGSIRRMVFEDFKLYGKYFISATAGLPAILKDRGKLKKDTYDQLMAMRAAAKAPDNLAEGY